MAKTKTNSTVLDVLVSGRDLIANQGWCSGNFTKEINGTEHFCAVGALIKATGGKTNNYPLRVDAMKVLDSEAQSRGFSDIVDMNDSVRDRRYILRAFNRAIELASTH
jgi:hypothetical protein